MSFRGEHPTWVFRWQGADIVEPLGLIFGELQLHGREIAIQSNNSLHLEKFRISSRSRRFERLSIDWKACEIKSGLNKPITAIYLFHSL